MDVENSGFLHRGISPLLAMRKVAVLLSLSILAASTVVVLLSLHVSILALRELCSFELVCFSWISLVTASICGTATLGGSLMTA